MHLALGTQFCCNMVFMAIYSFIPFYLIFTIRVSQVLSSFEKMNWLIYHGKGLLSIQDTPSGKLFDNYFHENLSAL